MNIPIITTDIIITIERIDHINKRHNNDYNNYGSYITEIIASPDYILEDNTPHTVILLKKIVSENENFALILRLHTKTDNPNYKNSILTFWKIRQRNYDKLVRNGKILFQRLDKLA